LLVLEHLGGLQLPGCGAESPCGRATASVWGRVPGTQWSTASVGLAYFAALAAAWIANMRRIAGPLRWLVRVGGAASVGFTVVMIAGGYLCPYCIAVHLGNLAFCVVTEAWSRGEGRAARQAATGAGTFVAATLLLAAVEWGAKQYAHARAESDLAESTARLVQTASRPTDNAAQGARLDASEGAASAPVNQRAASGLAGRWRLGPEVAPIRVVAFFSYPCKQCKALEQQIMQLYRERGDMSVSVKHFPMGKDCNKYIVTDVHPNACWAARAAEAAGLLRGPDAFWQMHEWLFANEGSFDGPKLRSTLQQFGYDVAEFQRVMQGEETLARVREDIDDGVALGLWFTPMIFINGVELRGWNAPNAVRRAVEALAATNPPPLPPTADHPPLALEKLIEDWRQEPLREIQIGAKEHVLGPAQATVQVVVFGDYRQDASSELYGILRDAAQRRGDVRVAYRQFPFNERCNSAVKRTMYEDACDAALAAEAAGLLADADGFWRMHDWLMASREPFDDRRLSDAAKELGFDPAALAAAAKSPEAQAEIERQCREAAQLGVNTVPTVFVNGRRVSRWKHVQTVIVDEIIEAARRERRP
jgi:protein-disulfide isomerase/uncharacterized membrane protein